MDWNLYVITPLGGAIIGYFTNWLAIKMLFRPHEEKRLFGIRVPFTPGLIPKERLRISNKIGEAIGQHVLTNDVLTETVLKNEKVFVDYIDGFIEKLKAEPMTPADIFEKLSGTGTTSEFEALSDYICDMLVKTVQSPDTADKIAGLVHELVIKVLKSENANELALNLINRLKPELLERIREYLQSGALEEFIEKSADNLFIKLQEDDRVLTELIPEKAVEAVKAAINDKLPDLADIIKNLPFNNITVDTALRELTNKVIDENISPVAALFINKDKIYSNMRFGLLEFLSNKDNLKSISDKIGEIIDKFMSHGTSHYIAMLPADANLQLREGLTKMVSENISYEFVEKILLHTCDSATDYLVGKSSEIDDPGKLPQDGTIYDMMIKFMPLFEDSLKRFIHTRIAIYLEENAQSLIDNVYASIKAYVIKFRIDSFITNIEPENMSKIKSTVLRFIGILLDKGVKALFEGFDIAKIAEEQINKFDMKTAEDIIVSVANRELKAITYLGGVLGLVIGFMPAIMRIFGI